MSESARTIVITGAAGGMGRRFVSRFLGDGDTVVATDASASALDDLLATTSGAYHASNLVVQQADITDEESVETLVELIRGRTGQVDVLINAAGWFPIQSFDEITIPDFRKVVDINLTGTFLVTKALVPFLRAAERGRIINIGSGSVFVGVATQIHYVAAKSALTGLTRSLARALGDDGITVNTVTPGVTVTDVVRETFPDGILDEAIAARAIRREETADDLVGPVHWLASRDADFVTGQTINVDGGASMI